MGDNGWALILGASSGFGAATGQALAQAGFDIFGVHLDRRATMDLAQDAQARIREAGREAVFFNVNAADDGKRGEVLDAVRARLGAEGQVRVLVHSLAFGTLTPFVGPGAVTRAQLEMTLDVMANSLVYWTQDLAARGLLADGGRIFAMTSAGGRRVWPSYGPVSAAKAALESHCRQLALELAPRRIAVNAVRAGVTDTPALRKIPGHEKMLARALELHPAGRLTRPEDVARCIAALCDPRAGWMTGDTLGVDGGEDNVG